MQKRKEGLQAWKKREKDELRMSTFLSLMWHDCQGSKECHVVLSNITPNNQLMWSDLQSLFSSSSLLGSLFLTSSSVLSVSYNSLICVSSHSEVPLSLQRLQWLMSFTCNHFSLLQLTDKAQKLFGSPTITTLTSGTVLRVWMPNISHPNVAQATDGF